MAFSFKMICSSPILECSLAFYAHCGAAGHAAASHYAIPVGEGLTALQSFKAIPLLVPST